ncbi:immediate early response gene 2 protein [Sceloporus undulatus]|uniref:immediate early response gene 2 protein n=1 Tax=Sceloporus undulatus TaxID=8520 RepID=UPI001C4B28D9|nr:immediate early response gene 2 protein [Sceloporus undulatus]
MEVQKEAQRIMTMSVWKMYHSRMQRGGLRLHRSLQLSLVMRNARDLYLSAKLEEEEEEEQGEGEGEGARGGMGACGGGLVEAVPVQQDPRAPCDASAAEPEPMETQEEPEGGGGGGGRGSEAHPPPWRPSAKPSRKRRSSSLGKMGASEDAEAGLVPSKKARLEGEEGERPPQGQEGPFPSLARVLQDRFSGLIPATTAAATAPGPEEAKGGCCRQGEGVLSILVRAVVAF